MGRDDERTNREQHRPSTSTLRSTSALIAGVAIGAVIIGGEALAGAPPTYSFSQTCSEPEDLPVITNTGTGPITAYAGMNFSVLNPGGSTVIGYYDPSNPDPADVMWFVGAGGFSENPTIIGSGNFAVCTIPNRPRRPPPVHDEHDHHEHDRRADHDRPVDHDHDRSTGHPGPDGAVDHDDDDDRSTRRPRPRRCRRPPPPPPRRPRLLAPRPRLQARTPRSATARRPPAMT